MKNRSSLPEVFCKKGVLRNFAKFTGKHLCQSLFFNKVAGAACNFIKKETLTQVFSCEFCEISKNTFSQRTPLVAASGKKPIKVMKEMKSKQVTSFLTSSADLIFLISGKLFREISEIKIFKGKYFQDMSALKL